MRGDRLRSQTDSLIASFRPRTRVPSARRVRCQGNRGRGRSCLATRRSDPTRFPAGHDGQHSLRGAQIATPALSSDLTVDRSGSVGGRAWRAGAATATMAPARQRLPWTETGDPAAAPDRTPRCTPPVPGPPPEPSRGCGPSSCPLYSPAGPAVPVDRGQWALSNDLVSAGQANRSRSGTSRRSRRVAPTPSRTASYRAAETAGA